MNTQTFLPCGGGSNLILGMGRENQIFFVRAPAIVNFFTKLTKTTCMCKWQYI